MQRLDELRLEVRELFHRGKFMASRPNNHASNAQPGAMAGAQIDPTTHDLIRSIDRIRALEGERYLNHLLRNLMQQSNKRLEDLGAPVVDETADLKIMLRKAQSDEAIAKRYANHFGQSLGKIARLEGGEYSPEAHKIADEALKWDGSAAAEKELEAALQQQRDHSTH